MFLIITPATLLFVVVKFWQIAFIDVASLVARAWYKFRITENSIEIFNPSLGQITLEPRRRKRITVNFPNDLYNPPLGAFLLCHSGWGKANKRTPCVRRFTNFTASKSYINWKNYVPCVTSWTKTRCQSLILLRKRKHIEH